MLVGIAFIGMIMGGFSLGNEGVGIVNALATLISVGVAFWGIYLMILYAHPAAVGTAIGWRDLPRGSLYFVDLRYDARDRFYNDTSLLLARRVRVQADDEYFLVDGSGLPEAAEHFAVSASGVLKITHDDEVAMLTEMRHGKVESSEIVWLKASAELRELVEMT